MIECCDYMHWDTIKINQQKLWHGSKLKVKPKNDGSPKFQQINVCKLLDMWLQVEHVSSVQKPLSCPNFLLGNRIPLMDCDILHKNTYIHTYSFDARNKSRNSAIILAQMRENSISLPLPLLVGKQTSVDLKFHTQILTLNGWNMCLYLPPRCTCPTPKPLRALGGQHGPADVGQRDHHTGVSEIL